MADVAETYQLDLLHVHYAIPHSISALLARQMIALSAHGACLSSPRCTAPTSRWSARTAPTSASPNSPSSNPTASPPSAKTAQARPWTSSASRTKSASSTTSSTAISTNPIPNARHRRIRAQRGEAPDPPFQFPAGETRARLHPHTGRGPQACRVRLLMVGDGPERGPAEHLAWTLGVEDSTSISSASRITSSA